MILSIKVIPNASKNSIEGWHEGVLKVKIQAVPDKGKANHMLIDFLSQEWKIPKARIQILSGHTSRLKRVEIEGVDAEFIHSLQIRNL